MEIMFLINQDVFIIVHNLIISLMTINTEDVSIAQSNALIVMVLLMNNVFTVEKK